MRHPSGRGRAVRWLRSCLRRLQGDGWRRGSGEMGVAPPAPLRSPAPHSAPRSLLPPALLTPQRVLRHAQAQRLQRGVDLQVRARDGTLCGAKVGWKRRGWGGGEGTAWRCAPLPAPRLSLDLPWGKASRAWGEVWTGSEWVRCTTLRLPGAPPAPPLLNHRLWWTGRAGGKTG